MSVAVQDNENTVEKKIYLVSGNLHSKVRETTFSKYNPACLTLRRTLGKYGTEIGDGKGTSVRTVGYLLGGTHFTCILSFPPSNSPIIIIISLCLL